MRSRSSDFDRLFIEVVKFIIIMIVYRGFDKKDKKNI
jgi:hypothetical protein